MVQYYFYNVQFGIYCTSVQSTSIVFSMFIIEF